MLEFEYKKWMHKAVHQAQAQNERCAKAFRLSSWPRWQTELDKGHLYFVEDGIPRVVASVLVAGSISNRCGTWLWSWGNESLPTVVKDEMFLVRAWGVKENIAQLSDPKFPADQEDAWELASAALRILDGKGIYRCPHDAGAIWVVFRDIRYLDVSTDLKNGNRISCEEHGTGLATFICQHLCAKPAQTWCSDELSLDNPWPGAWCTECQKSFERFGEWRDANSGVLGLKLLCQRCYDSARSQASSNRQI